MRWTYLFGVLLLLCAATVFVPHFRAAPDTYRPTSLGGIYQDFFTQWPKKLDGERLVLLLLILSAILSSFFPALLVAMVHALPSGGIKRLGGLYVLIGTMVLVGAAANFAIIMLNRIGFHFGPPAPIGIAGLFAWGVALWQVLFALIAIAIGFSAPCAALAGRWVH
jgi:hypothetical protein